MSLSASKRYVAKQRRDAARRVAGQLLPRASKAERREEKRARRIRREGLRIEQEQIEAERRRLDTALANSPLMRGDGTGEPVGIAADMPVVVPPGRPLLVRRRTTSTLAMIAAIAALGGRP